MNIPITFKCQKKPTNKNTINSIIQKGITTTRMKLMRELKPNSTLQNALTIFINLGIFLFIETEYCQKKYFKFPKCTKYYFKFHNPNLRKIKIITFLTLNTYVKSTIQLLFFVKQITLINTQKLIDNLTTV